MKRWIPKKGERVTLAGDGRDLPSWSGVVEQVSKIDCGPGEVYLYIAGRGPTFASSHEITIHGSAERTEKEK
jgi:hypothetical protein